MRSTNSANLNETTWRTIKLAIPETTLPEPYSTPMVVRLRFVSIARRRDTTSTTVERKRMPRRIPVSSKTARRTPSKTVGESALETTWNAGTAGKLDTPKEIARSRRERKNSKPGETRNSLARREKRWRPMAMKRKFSAPI